MNTAKFSSAITGSSAPPQLPASRQRTTSKANMAASRYASHFMRMGMKKNSSTWVLGNRNAKAKNMDRFT